MNYYEHRLREIREQITALACREDCNDLLDSLQEERRHILNELRYNK